MHPEKRNVLVIGLLVLLCFVAKDTLAKGDGWQPGGGAHQKGGGAPLGGWDDEVMGNILGDSIPGIPGRSYPNHDKIPDTGFDCRAQKDPGYYGDTEAQCQVFHVCQEGGRRNSFLCPLGTLFNQETFVCDWWFNVNCGDTPDHYVRNGHLHRGPDVGIDGRKIHRRQQQGNAKGGSGTDHQVGIPTWGPPGEGNRNPQQAPNRAVGGDSWGNHGIQGNEKGRQGGQNSMGASPGNRRQGGKFGNSWMNRMSDVQQNGDRRQRGHVVGMGDGNAHFPQNGRGGNAHAPNQKGGGSQGGMVGGNAYVSPNGIGQNGGNAQAPNQKGGGRGRPSGGNAAGPFNQRRWNRRQNRGGNDNILSQKGVGNVQPNRRMRNRVRQEHNARAGQEGMDARPNPGWGNNDQGSAHNQKGYALQGMNGVIHHKEFDNGNAHSGNAFSPNHKGGEQKGEQQLGNDVHSNEGPANANLQGRNDFSPHNRGGQKGQQHAGGNNRNGGYPNEGPVDGNVNFQDRNDFSPNHRGPQQGRNDGWNGGGQQGNNKGSRTVSFQANRWSMDSRHFQHSSNHHKGDGYGDQGSLSFDGSQEGGFKRHLDQSSRNVVGGGIRTGFGDNEGIDEGVGDFTYDYPEGNSRQFKEQGSYEGKADYNDYSYTWIS